MSSKRNQDCDRSKGKGKIERVSLYQGEKENLLGISAFVGIGVTLIVDPFGLDSIRRSATAKMPETVLLGTSGE
jgi:hypothetical protein